MHEKDIEQRYLGEIAESEWIPPVLPADILCGDMPGDKVKINKSHILKANVIFPEMCRQLKEILKDNKYQKAVVAVCGGSGVGKSETASILSYYFHQLGVGSYTLSGDNYPHRIPEYNDAERLRVFREGALKGLVTEGKYSQDRFAVIHNYQMEGDDANPVHTKEHPWFESYLRNGKVSLKNYLGTKHEIGFDDVEQILTAFKGGEKSIWLKRMGRKNTELWYESVDFSKVQVMIIEWTHGNSDNLKGVDVPILLNSTPQETLMHRSSRKRDRDADSPFITMVLELEQKMLEQQAHKAKIIVSKSSELLSYEQYCKAMQEGGNEY